MFAIVSTCLCGSDCPNCEYIILLFVIGIKILLNKSSLFDILDNSGDNICGVLFASAIFAVVNICSSCLLLVNACAFFNKVLVLLASADVPLAIRDPVPLAIAAVPLASVLNLCLAASIYEFLFVSVGTANISFAFSWYDSFNESSFLYCSTMLVYCNL